MKGARGELAAFDLDKGDEKWHKEVKGGVVSCAALTDEAAVVTATDGKVRAFDLETGERRWIYTPRRRCSRRRPWSAAWSTPAT